MSSRIRVDCNLTPFFILMGKCFCLSQQLPQKFGGGSEIYCHWLIIPVFTLIMSGTSTASELQRLIQTSSEASQEQTPFPWTDEFNPPVSIVEALAGLPPAPQRRQETCRQQPINVGVETVHTFPEPQGVRAPVAQVGQRIRLSMRGVTQTMLR